jgi:hypothetical protein
LLGWLSIATTGTGAGAASESAEVDLAVRSSEDGGTKKTATIQATASRAIELNTAALPNAKR